MGELREVAGLDFRVVRESFLQEVVTKPGPENE